MRANLMCLSLCLLAGCVTADVLRVDHTPRPAIIDRNVPLLLDEPTRPYTSIALVEISTSTGAGLEKMGRRLSEEAAKLGGDAVLLTRRAGGSTSTLVPVGDSFVSTDSEHSRLVGIVIVFRDP